MFEVRCPSRAIVKAGESTVPSDFHFRQVKAGSWGFLVTVVMSQK